MSPPWEIIDYMDIKSLHHVAYRCKDAKQTAEFYTKVLGLEYAMAMAEDRVPRRIIESTNKRTCMEHLIREFGAWLKQGFGWLVDVIVFGCLWGISQVSRLLGTHLGGAPILNIVALVLVLLL